MSHVIGIDLGTTNSCVAVCENGQVSVVPNAGGYKTTPSIFALAENGKRLVGHFAKRQAVTNPKNTVYASKRFIGRNFDCESVQRAAEYTPYELIRGSNNDVRVQIEDKEYTCQEIAAIILHEMKRVAEEYLGEPVTQAVITVPAYFNDTQRTATKDARIAVYDLGGGTFDISVLEMSDGVIEVLSTAGDTFLGGEDFDRTIVGHLVQEFDKEQGIDLSGDAMALQRLKDAAEKAKCDLSLRTTAEVNLPFIANGPDGPCHLNIELTREALENLVGDKVRATMKTVEKCVADSNVPIKDIDQVILVGGQTRMPMVQSTVAEFFGKVPHKGVNPDEVVAMGAAIQGQSLVAKDDTPVLLLDVTPLSLGIATFGGNVTHIIERNSTVPIRRKHIFTTTRDDQQSVKIRVLQGESMISRENDLLGEFELMGIRPAPKGEPEIEVTFAIDANGIVSASAQDLATGLEQSITVNASGTLPPDEVERIMEGIDLDEIEFKE
ncbi:MAG: Hsp70 family protein [Deltaproteobacteria bacterium]|nr:Hsp70 family protein [Deltaproteobacteria bacterium]